MVNRKISCIFTSLKTKKMENLLIVLRGISAGYKTIFQNEAGNYVSKQVDNFQTHTLHEGCEEFDIESRLKYELYGEYPLSLSNELDYNKNVKPAFKF